MGGMWWIGWSFRVLVLEWGVLERVFEDGKWVMVDIRMGVWCYFYVVIVCEFFLYIGFLIGFGCWNWRIGFGFVMVVLGVGFRV